MVRQPSLKTMKSHYLISRRNTFPNPIGSPKDKNIILYHYKVLYCHVQVSPYFQRWYIAKIAVARFEADQPQYWLLNWLFIECPPRAAVQVMSNIGDTCQRCSKLISLQLASESARKSFRTRHYPLLLVDTRARGHFISKDKNSSRSAWVEKSRGKMDRQIRSFLQQNIPGNKY